MDLEKIPHRFVDSISFSVFSTEELLRQGVLEVTCSETFDIVGHPTKGGLHDALLGPSDRDEVCATCGLGFTHCPGHIGYIRLPLLVFNPVFLRTLYQLLRGSCFSCHRLLSPPVACQVALAQLQVLQYGAVGAVQELQDIANETLTDDDDKGRLVHRGAVRPVLQRRIEQSVASVIDSVGDVEEARRTADVKNVVECRQRIVKTFIREHLMGAPRKCPHCGELRRAMTIQNNSRFVYTSKIRPAVKPPTSSMPFRSTHNGFEDEDDMLVEEEEERQRQAQQKQAEEEAAGGELSYLTPVEARAHLRELWAKERSLLQNLFGILALASGSHESPVDMFFLEALVVPPTRFRPMNFMNGRKYENAQTVSLSRVLQCCDTLRAVLKLLARRGSDQSERPEDQMETERLEQLVSKMMGKDLDAKMHFAWNALQVAVNVVVDSELDRLNTNKGTPGIKQILEKKEGLFRKHMMGKRVNYAARSVISPDPYIDVEEIGVPMVFATKLSYPEPVTDRNIAELRRAVINGPDIYPGALLVEREDGVVMRLDPTNRTRREAVAKQLLTPTEAHQHMLRRCKTVHRHLRSGDMLLLNRQPTLHKPSIMAHRARVLPGERTLRLHYANCKCYNADFDGDEMNAHLPQSPLAQAEATEVASVNRQYLVPKDGTPLSGLIQDHVIGGSLLTMQGRFFTREDYNQLVFGALTFVKMAIKLLPPAVQKPQALWTGKQVLSTVLLNCIPHGKPPPTVEGKAKIPAKAWSKGGEAEANMTEGDVVIRDGELLCGILDKAHYGPTQFGLVHVCYELYGGATSSLVLSAFARLFTHYLQTFTGFTLGIEDILVTDKADRKRKRIMKKAKMQGDAVAVKALGLENEEELDAVQLEDRLRAAHMARNDRQMKQLDSSMKGVTDDVNNQINKACIPDGLLKKFPSNNLQLMVQSGAKGGMVNCMQISCLLGQIELEGHRVPLMLSGRTLPSFLHYDTSPRAGGFVDGRFLTGIRPQEYFFHCMAGREGLVDTAVKTSRSGYLQRCLIKHLEGLMVCYDQTVRDSDGSVIQFQYGEDGLDVLKMQMLKPSQFPVLIKNSQAVINRDDIEQCARATDHDKLYKLKRVVRKWRNKMDRDADTHTSRRQSAFTLFSQTQGSLVREEHFSRFHNGTSETARQAILEAYFNLDERTRHKLNKSTMKCADPVCSKLRSDVHLGAVSERLDTLIEDYIEKNPHGLVSAEDSGEGQAMEKKTVTADDFRKMVYIRNMKAICDPGEPVGLLAAQSIGEPSTQMTLNTFHFAGRGEMNVTLGIPRMREILMVASANIATPTMDLHLLPQPDIEQRAEELRVKITSINLSQVLEEVSVKEMLHVKGRSERYRRYRVHFQFLPRRAYRKKLQATPARILRYMETTFLRRLIDSIKRKMEQVSSERMTRTTKARERRGEEAASAEDASMAPPRPEADEGGESSDEGEGDGDTVAHQAAARHAQEREYEEAEEEERVAVESDEELLDGAENVPATERALPSAEEGATSDDILVSLQAVVRDEKAEKLKQARIFSVVKYNTWVLEYDYDDAKEEWCTFTFQLELKGSKFDFTSLVEEESAKAVFHSVPSITRAFLVKDTKDKSGCGKMLQTEGVNFVEMFRYGEIIDLKRIYSNDIHAIANTFGIEAARTAIAREVANVFAVYGIEVDPRHLLLVADYMTFDGSYRACNRIAMESNASPLQQMTFETTMNFLKSATLAGAEDHLNSPSARLVVGRVVPLGTGCMQLRQPQVPSFKLRSR
ncbi:RNA polymerase I subunit RpI1 isoform X2 [Dermacentor variabilis]|uniref:RNA polymerase I subunit RpI1 isoform X2 n=1 Tax=Dermacentor variabilis TaxID=34621 RepID=UPI003F5B939A